MDADDTGHTDLIRKTMAVSGGESQEVNDVYMLEYYNAVDKAYYTKIAMKHKWFGFLSMP